MYNHNLLINKKVLKVGSIDDLPPAVSGVISIPTLTALVFEGVVDLGTNRLVFDVDCAVLGTTSETSYLKSTLPNNVPLITAIGSLPIQNITLEVIASSGTPYIFELDGIAETAAALDWFGVNCRNSKLGNIKNYANFVATLCAFIDTKGGFVFDGTFDSIVFTNSIFRGVAASGTHITITNTATINKRVRLVDTPIIVPTGVVGLNVSTSAVIPTEGYILRFINFSGGGTYLQGVQPDDNKSVVIECRGVSNSGNVGEYYMVNNATATTISNTTSFFKIAGTTTAGTYLQRVTVTNNRATYTGAITRFFLVQCTMSMNVVSGNTQLLIVRIAKNGVTIASSESQTTTSNAGRSENVKCQTIVQLSTNDYVEVFIQNSTSSTNVIVSELNTILIPLS